MAQSIYDRIGRGRSPRVHITYEVTTNGAQVLREIPFVLGVMSDLSGQPSEPLPRLRDRKFTEVDRDNFDDVLRGMQPRLVLQVENTLKGDGSQLGMELNFKKLADFRPENVADQIEPLRQLKEVRAQLKDLLVRLEGNERLGELLEAVLANTDVRDKLGASVGAELRAENEDSES